jgi:hypothetical protein
MKNLSLKPEEIREIAPNRGACLATDKITVDGALVGYMYREEPMRALDNGWRFFAGDETDEYLNDINNVSIYDLNTIANFDGAILPYLDAPYGSQFERVEGQNKFRMVSS